MVNNAQQDWERENEGEIFEEGSIQAVEEQFNQNFLI